MALGMAALVLACGGAPSAPAPASSPAAASATRPATGAAASAAAGTDTLDITFAGALQGHWGTGDRSTGLTCSGFGNNQVQVSLFGMLNGTRYGLGVRQDRFTGGNYTFPATNPTTSP